jgi:hypothetical protein
MEEREKYESWLDDLEAKKDSTPPKVFERVRQDYLTRLQEVMDKLSEHTALLEEHGQSLTAKLRELEMAEESITEQQAEAALRKQVGEITPAEWESSSKKAQKELTKLRESQEEVAEELDRIRNLLGDEEEEEEEVQRPAKKKKDFNELEFLTKVVGTSPPSPDSVPPPKPRATPQGTPTTRSSGPSAPRATPSAVPAAAPPPAAPSPAPVAASTSGESAAVPAATASPRPTETPPLGVPNQPRKSAMAEQPKTLKCAECGTMNFPSEWYCERCGAELTIV